MIYRIEAEGDLIKVTVSACHCEGESYIALNGVFDSHAEMHEYLVSKMEAASRNAFSKLKQKINETRELQMEAVARAEEEVQTRREDLIEMNEFFKVYGGEPK